MGLMITVPINSSPVKGSTAAAWRSRAEELTAWTFDSLVNRFDAWGGHYLEDGHVWRETRPLVAFRGECLLRWRDIEEHDAPRSVGDLMGLHSTSEENTSLWDAADVDAHPGDASNPVANLAASRAWFDVLRDLGFMPLLEDSNSKGGYHLWVFFSEPVPTPLAYAFFQWLTADYADHGLLKRPETFPKQPSIPPGGYGNWLRLPGKHPKHDHHSRFWDGRRWLEDADAVEYMLAILPSSPSLIPDAVKALVPPEPPDPVTALGPPGPAAAPTAAAPPAPVSPPTGHSSVEDDYNARGPDMLDLLAEAGWVLVGTKGELRYVRRPGKSDGQSGTIGLRARSDGTELFHCHTPNAHPAEEG
jgi:hypothetical protein